MVGFILLILSIALVAGSSYFLTSFVKSRRDQNSLLFWILIIAAQIILSFEILSLLNQINIPAFLGINFGFFLSTFTVWNIKGKPVLNFDWIREFFQKARKAIAKDRILAVLAGFFIFASFVSLFLAIFAPTNLWDSMIYQVARVAFWIQNGTLAHFETNSLRQVIFPPNSGMFMLWSMLFLKNDFLIGMSQYMSYLGSIFVIYNFLSYLKISTARILWTIFIFASLPAIIVQSSGTQDHLMLGFFLLTSLYLVFYGINENENKSLFFSALALGMAFGVKTSIFMFLPALIFAYCLIAWKKQGKLFYKTALQYIFYLIPIILIFSSYFYIMNYLEFGNPLGHKAFIYEHTHSGKCLSAFAANFIRYIFGFIDFSGFDGAKVLSFPFLLAKTLLFKMFGLSGTEGLMHGIKSNEMLLVNTRITDIHSFLGPLGALIFLPLLVLSVKKYIFSTSRKTFLPGICGLIFVLFIITISYLMGYQSWNNRYMITAAVIAAPILAFSYNPTNRFNILKWLVFTLCIFTFIKIPLFNELRPICQVRGKSLLINSRQQIRYEVAPLSDSAFPDPVRYLEKKAKDNSKIGLIFPEFFWHYQYHVQNPDWKIFSLNSKFLNNEKLQNLDYLVVFNDTQKIYSLEKENEYYKDVKVDFDMISKYFHPEYCIRTQFNKNKYKTLKLGHDFKFCVFAKNSPKELE